MKKQICIDCHNEHFHSNWEKDDDRNWILGRMLCYRDDGSIVNCRLVNFYSKEFYQYCTYVNQHGKNPIYLKKEFCKKCNGADWNERDEERWKKDKVVCPNNLRGLINIRCKEALDRCNYKLEILMMNVNHD